MTKQKQNPPVKHITGHQKVTPTKVELSKELRKSMTTGERKLWEHLRANRLNGFHFRRQQIVDGFIVDFYCHQAGLVIEIDGEIHETQKDYDAVRENALQQKGMSIIRFSNTEIVTEIDVVLFKISEACKKQV